MAAAPVIAAVFVACSGSNVLDNDRVQQLIGQWLEDNVQVTANVTCPNNEPMKADDTFNCSAVTRDGLTLTIQVTQTDDQGDVDFEIQGAS